MSRSDPKTMDPGLARTLLGVDGSDPQMLERAWSLQRELLLQRRALAESAGQRADLEAQLDTLDRAHEALSEQVEPPATQSADRPPEPAPTPSPTPTSTPTPESEPASEAAPTLPSGGETEFTNRDLWMGAAVGLLVSILLIAAILWLART